jgi:hypothetical protein
MPYKLLCGGDPVTLGIANTEGTWSLDALKRHILECPMCAALTQHLASVIQGEETPSGTGNPKGN